ncbi:hypothetical protein ACJMK2_025631 [Sinanodonta woodiana]|uniref:Integrase core domain-containing protein n=1 Tax=Sinanodonta woodiana TaxID=1069815 RepID=A0ABD3XKU8_SINWO
MDFTAFIKLYFSLGLSYSEFICCLAIIHKIVISMRTLKRRLTKLRLYRRKYPSNILNVASYVAEQFSESGCQNGYGRMHPKCLLAGFRTSRSDVAALLSLLDLQGCELRRRKRLRRRNYYAKGPNFIWHLDSYDKLKRYGLCINGCIDEFSRKIIWCKVTCSTSNPRIIAGHYIDAIEQLCACPKAVRGDRGTKNTHVAEMHNFLTNTHSFIFGPSTANQRIESFWRLLRMKCCQFWIEFFFFTSERNMLF